ncbi:MAG TPA: (d)CMP kinase [Pirellulales bacterium]|jgi:cytidylate kinase|nr:(d)CMP kinase [Pirellulales bacterium]
MIVVIDGPAGAGKSSAARALARRLGFRFLDTGAMYRAVVLAALRQKLELADAAALAALARTLHIELAGDRVLLAGEDVTSTIRSADITALTHYAADNPAVREHLVELQRAAAGQHNVVSEGRDQGTVVFPHAECKFFVTASPAERARRRMRDLEARGEHLGFDEVLAAQELRDTRDRTRAVGPLIPAADALEIWTDGLSPDEVVARLESIVRAKMAQ